LKHYRLLAPAFPALVDAANLPEADVLLSSSYGFAHRFRTGNRAPQVCFCHSPLRFAWTMTDRYRDEVAPGGLAGAVFSGLAAAMRRSDRRASARVDRYLTQSPFVADQIRRFYGRDAEVVGAPVDCERFRPASGSHDGYYLLCGRIVEPYKRVSMAVEAFRRLPARLVVAGDGPALPELRRTAPPNVEFLGHLEDDALIEAMQRCGAALFPSRDDFGLIPVEVMACGRPVLAYGDGGALYTVRAGITGEFFEEQTADALVDAVRSFDPDAYDPEQIREHARGWDSPRFRERAAAAVEAAAQA
jgi:glycosyltransferase involved in cell wall biosynthesis